MKKPVFIFAGSVLLLSIVAVGVGNWLGHDRNPDTHSLTASAGNLVPVPLLNGEQKPSNLTPTTHPLPANGTDSPLLPLPATLNDASLSMHESLLHGDPNAPRVIHDSTGQEAATPEELADPKLYAQYEARQNVRMFKAYVQAADTEIPRLQQDIAKAKAAGLKPEQIAEGEEKLRRIQQMRDQLASEHP